MLLCQLSIVGHCCPLYPQGLCYPHCWVLQARNSLLQENIYPDTSPGVDVNPSCNATAMVLYFFVKVHVSEQNMVKLACNM